MAARLLVVALVASCGAPATDGRRSSITNGAADASDPAVAALLSLDGRVECSGTLIAPHAILTAAHCGVDASTFDQFVVSFGATASLTGAFALSDARPHPQYDPGTHANDLALLTLRLAAPAAPMALDARPVDGSWVGQSFTVAGFGATAATVGDEGQKRSGTARVTAVGAADFTAAPSPSQPCGGDSGGPALFSDGTATVLTGVTSHGDEPCVDHAVFARVDVQQAAFLQPYLASLASQSLETGDRCLFDEQCKSGPCLQAADEPKRSFCSRSCRAAADCPKRMSCAPDGCRYSAPSPGALGAACAQSGDCVSGVCNAGACTRSCVPTRVDCPAGFQCRNTSGITFQCVAVPHPGCELGGRGAGGSLWLVALGLVAAASRLRLRRRRLH